MMHVCATIRHKLHYQLLIIYKNHYVCSHSFTFFRVIGVSGRGWKWMVIEYGKLDTRYWRTKDPCVMLISYMELVIMGPLCILWYSTVCAIINPLTSA